MVTAKVTSVAVTRGSIIVTTPLYDPGLPNFGSVRLKQTSRITRLCTVFAVALMSVSRNSRPLEALRKGATDTSSGVLSRRL
jgi:hypothetical protein